MRSHFLYRCGWMFWLVCRKHCTRTHVRRGCRGRQPETGTLERWTVAGHACIFYIFSYCSFYSQMRRAHIDRALFSLLRSAHLFSAESKVTNNNLNLVKFIQCRHRVNELNELKRFNISKTNSLPAISVSRFVSSVVVAGYFSSIASAVVRLWRSSSTLLRKNLNIRFEKSFQWFDIPSLSHRRWCVRSCNDDHSKDRDCVDNYASDHWHFQYWG